jgi:hypothetical protein
MADTITAKKERIKRETEELEADISKNQKQDSDAEQKISKCMAHFSDVMKEGKEKRTQWHQEVDDIFDHLDTLTQYLRDHQVKALKSYQSQLRSQNSSMVRIVEENKEILKSKNVSDVNNHQVKLTGFKYIPQVPDLVLPSHIYNEVQGEELCLQLLEYKAKLTKFNLPDDLSLTKLSRKAKVIAYIPTNVEQLLRVACVGSDRAWISGLHKTIRVVDIHGTVTDTVTNTCTIFPSDITVNRQGELIYSDSYNGTVKIVRHGKTKTLITTPQGWHPSGLCCTISGGILVCMRTTDNYHYKIVRYQGQSVIHEIDKDDRGNPIYQGGKKIMYVTENINSDIVASDTNANTVVVVDRIGKVRFRYKKNPPGAKKSFGPRLIVTDSIGNIIVGDYFNQCLHILDQSGQFLRCVDNGLYKPIGLSVDSKGRLWVGQFQSGKVNVIQYMK